MKQINPEQLEAKIKHEKYHRIGDTMTVCSLVLHSGFVVIGQSACIDPAKYDEAVGCEMARKNAVNQLWALEGYHVKETNYAAQAAMEA